MVCRLLWWYFHRRQYCWGSMVRVSAVKGSQIITCAAPFTVTKGNKISTKGVERCHTGCYDVVAAHSAHTPYRVTFVVCFRFALPSPRGASQFCASVVLFLFRRLLCYQCLFSARTQTHLHRQIQNGITLMDLFDWSFCEKSAHFPAISGSFFECVTV